MFYYYITISKQNKTKRFGITLLLSCCNKLYQKIHKHKKGRKRNL